MRLNQYIAQATGISRRAADTLIIEKRVRVNNKPGQLGQDVSTSDHVFVDGKLVQISDSTTTIMLNKPVGYVTSRDGQGSRTIYELLPKQYHNLKPIGRLDKDSSGLLLLTNDGQLAHQLTHPSFEKTKVYEIRLNKALAEMDDIKIEQGVKLIDGLSRLQLKGNGQKWTVTMHEGRNRQIRRTFEALGYKVTKLHRTQFGSYTLNKLTSGKFITL